MLSQARAFFPPRYRFLTWVAALFLLVNLGLRLGLIAFEGDLSNFLPWNAFFILGVGTLYDLAAVTFLLIPFAILALFVPDSLPGRKLHGVLGSAWLLGALFAILFTSIAEVLFWNEFSARFNFIAVDYLIYTRETIGNVRQSYATGPLILGLVVVTVGTFLVILKPVWTTATAEGGRWSQRLQSSTAILLLPILASFAIGDTPRDVLHSTSARELAENGYYEFVRALRSNDIDFQQFYETLPQVEARAKMRHEFVEAKSTSTFTGGVHPLEREVTSSGTPLPLNVVIVTMESLGWEYVESLGGLKGLTPNLDRLGREGMLFTQVYATGTRTVRGLEAISLSLPPTPGLAVLTRKNNKGFQTIGGVLKTQGYEPIFIYGGYSYFDNMKDFFGSNGYTVVDRTALPAEEVSHETIWGVADEDLFTMVLRQIDDRAAVGQKVFAHVMTTSNHRPFTYPTGRIDMRPGSGRDGAVKYSDWAIGDFMRRAATRPWFKDTMFVFVADHTSRGRGRTDLPMENYRIPLIFYSPNHVMPARVEALASQIDIGPTLLALLNVSYTSQFFGQDILTEGQHHQRALLANYLTVGYVEDNVLVELSPKRRSRILDAKSGSLLSKNDPRAQYVLRETIAHFQVATDVLRGR